jgi:hypothetical protein
MEAALGPGSRFLFVYGTQSARATPALRERARRIAERLFGGDSTTVRADRDVDAATFASRPVLLLGRPEENAWTRRIAPGLPLAFTDSGFRLFGRTYERPDDVVHLVYPNPLAPERFLLLIAANAPEALARRGGFFEFGDDDWHVVRGGDVVRRGRFASDPAHPWRYDASLDRDLETERERFATTLVRLPGRALVVRSARGSALAVAARTRGDALLAAMSADGLVPRAGAAPIVLTLYHDLQEKGRIAHDTRPEHLGDEGAGAAPAAGRTTLDLWSVTAARWRQLGATRDAPLLVPAAVWRAGRLEGEPLDVAVARLYFARLLPTARDAAARTTEWRSPLIDVPARALLCRALWESSGSRAPRALVGALSVSGLSTLDSLCRPLGVDPERVARRYAALADSLSHAAERALREREARPWRPADGFQRGVCLAHSVDLESGYLSAECAKQLVTLKGMGVNWVSLTPFGYLPSLHTPEIYPSAEGGVDGETDEAVCEAAARARALGLRVWLKPHLWTRGWVGELDFVPSDWPRFFERYRAFVLHYALLAARERMDGLFVGHETVTASLGFPERFRALIGDVRRAYPGTLSYGANWDREVDGIAFWDALDLIGVSFYYPLADRPGADVATLTAGATRALAKLRALAARTGRPVLLDEVGYAPTASAALEPWQEAHGGASQPLAQRDCYEAVTRALEPADWVAGVFWWKWFSGASREADEPRTFSPRGQPAEAVMTRALRQWQGRPVRVLRAAPTH